MRGAQVRITERRAWLCGMVAMGAAMAVAQTPTTGPAGNAGRTRDPLATKQQIVRDRMTQLEDRMFRLIEKLSKTEPEQARKLEAAMKRAQELLIRRNMDEAIRLLEDSRLTDAAERQTDAAKGLEDVLRILLEEADNAQQRKEEIDQAKEYREKIERLLERQQALQSRPSPATQPGDNDSEAARQQRELQQETERLAKQMKGEQPAQENGKDDRQEPDPQDSERPSEPAAGSQNVEQAGQHMQKAAEQLERHKPREAGPEQQKAVERLERARRELDQALDQLRREQQEEILRGLESRFRAMLAGQLMVNEGTAELDKKSGDAWSHAEDVKLTGLAQDQAGLAEQAGQALQVLKEEGATVTFPRIVEQMRDDMIQVVALLNGKKTGRHTQGIESDVAATLKELIEAVKESRKQAQEGGGEDGGDQQQNPPLLPSSAELKLLRSCQERITRQTSEFYKQHADPAELDAEAGGQLEKIARRQQEVAEMARKMNERITGQ